MSLRPGDAAAAIKPTSAARLDAVLRAGQSFALVTKARGQAEEEDDVGSGLTKALKNASLVPTGACLPRGFDPDYCAYDRYYAVGVALVSAVLGALVDANVPQQLILLITSKVKHTLGDLCYTPPTDVYSTLMGKNKPFNRLTHDEAEAVKRSEFSALCQSLDSANTRMQKAGFPTEQEFLVEMWAPIECTPVPKDQQTWFDWLIGYTDCVYPKMKAEHEFYDRVNRVKEASPAFRFELLVRNMIRLIMLPGSMAGAFIVPHESFFYFNPSQNAEKLVQDMVPSTLPIPPPHPDSNAAREMDAMKSPAAQPNWLYVGAMAAWTLKHVSRYMNEHALMVASFFRTNARRLGAGQAPMLDLVAFARQCREDIADGANPPPPPPPAYEDFDPEAVAAERKRRDELRERAEARDPLMEGLDYPETYASASGAAPLRA